MDLIDTAEAAKILGIHPRSVTQSHRRAKRAAEQGLPHRFPLADDTIGGRPAWDRARIQELADERETT